MSGISLHDFETVTDEAKAHIVQRVVFWPKLWKEFKGPAAHVWKWKTVPLSIGAASQIPDDKNGIYTFVISPKIAEHPRMSLVIYVGKADRMSLRARFKSYFSEKKIIKRPKVAYFMQKYDGYLEFCYCIVETKKAHVTEAEDALIGALIPPANKKFPANISKILNAF